MVMVVGPSDSDRGWDVGDELSSWKRKEPRCYVGSMLVMSDQRPEAKGEKQAGKVDETTKGKGGKRAKRHAAATPPTSMSKGRSRVS
jgi:hypothetical protein